MSGRIHKLLRVFGLVAIACSLLAAPARGGEKIRFSDSDEDRVDVPKPTTRDDRIRARFGNRKDPGEDVGPNVPIAPSTPTATMSPLMAQKLSEYLKKKQNWLSEGATDKDKDKNSLSFDKRGKDNELSLDDFARSGKKDKTEDPKFDRQDPQRLFERKKSNTDERDDPDATDKAKTKDKTGSAQGGLEIANPLPKDEPSIRDLSEMSRVRALGGFAPEPSEAVRKLEREREQREHDTDFAHMIAPRSGGSSISTLLDPLNAQRDITRQDVNPFAPRSGLGMDGAGLAADSIRTQAGAAGAARSSVLDSFAGNAGVRMPATTMSPQAPAVSTIQREHKPIFFDAPRRAF